MHVVILLLVFFSSVAVSRECNDDYGCLGEGGSCVNKTCTNYPCSVTVQCPPNPFPQNNSCYTSYCVGLGEPGNATCVLLPCEPIPGNASSCQDPAYEPVYAYCVPGPSCETNYDCAALYDDHRQRLFCNESKMCDVVDCSKDASVCERYPLSSPSDRCYEGLCGETDGLCHYLSCEQLNLECANNTVGCKHPPPPPCTSNEECRDIADPLFCVAGQCTTLICYSDEECPLLPRDNTECTVSLCDLTYHICGYYECAATPPPPQSSSTTGIVAIVFVACITVVYLVLLLWLHRKRRHQ